MPFKRFCIFFFGAVEITIGILQGGRAAAGAVFDAASAFECGVIAAAGFLSVSLGLGLLLRKELAVKALLFFASGVGFSKILILGGIFSLPPAARILFEKPAENWISLGYHLLLAGFLLAVSKHRLD